MKSNTYIDFIQEINNKDPKFKIWWYCQNTKI